MSLRDFEGCTPQEFHWIYQSWCRHRVEEPWERTRFLACCMLQPYSKKALKASDVCRFPWEAERSKALPHEESTKERFEELVRRLEQ